MSKMCKQTWLLIFSCYLLCPPYTNSTPVPTTGRGRNGCPHESIAELIKTSPLILKALGARIFTDDDLNRLQIADEAWQKWLTVQEQGQKDQINFLASATFDEVPRTATIKPTATTTSSTSTPAAPATTARIWASKSAVQTASLAQDNNNNNSQQAPAFSGTPATESILITLTPETIYKGASLLKLTPGAGGAERSSSMAYQYEGQLNATLQPLSCFDKNLLNLLPTELIVFGKLVNMEQQEQEQQQQEQEQHNAYADAGAEKDVLRISINGLHRWSAQFESHIWKHLGWDDWSDFTLCSVTCGKGVQQRFRRCLLDNPLMNLNMNMNLNAVNSDDAADAEDADIDDVDVEFDGRETAINGKGSHAVQDIDTNDVKTVSEHQTIRGQVKPMDNNDDAEVMRISNGNFNYLVESESRFADLNERGRGAENAKNTENAHRPRRRRKLTKSISTMFCEGYNIEQRNCNTFECSDDISDLLKFYRRYEDANTQPLVANAPPATDFNASTTVAGADVAEATTNAAAALSTLPSSVSPNMGYVSSWHNALNFTLMLTLRVKNDSKTTATIFTIRNATHNLYLEPSRDGLRLYLERDNTTEMLPVKFNLYDYRWHQVAISIQNGDFISIYVDCSWTNSFVVSKRLFSLPLDADVEIGRGFNGELQQLLVLPDNQERHQCSSKRTSINEVKRYIIDTFIDDYGN